MEDERGAGGHDDGGGSDPPLSSKLAGESVVENMGSDNQAAEVFGEGDDEEIMVEVVGSDVYVDGVSGNGEGDSEMGEAGDLEGGVVEKNEESKNVSREGDGNKMAEGGVVEKNEESKKVSREGDGNKMAEGGLGSSESRDEKHGATEKIDINLSKSVGVEGEKVSALPVGGVSGVDDEECNPGIKAANGSSSEASAPPTEVAGASPMVICEVEKAMDETVDKDSSEVVMPESSNHPVEAVCDEKSDLAEEKEVLPSSDNSTSHDHVAADSVKSHGETEETHDGNDGVIGQIHPVNASGGGELLDSGTQKDGNFKADPECPSTDGDSGIQDKSVSENDVCAAESKNSIPEKNALVSEVSDESQNCSDEFHGAKLERKDQTGGASHAGPESVHENTFENRKGETGGNDESSKSGGDLETHKAQIDVSSGTPIKHADGDDTTEVNKDKCLNVEVKDDAQENVQNKTNLSCPTDKEIVRSDSGIDLDQPVIAKTVGAETPVFHARTKHVEVYYHFRKKVLQGEIELLHIKTEDQIALQT